MKFFPIISLSVVALFSSNCGSVDPNATISLPGSRNPLDQLRLDAGNASSQRELSGDPTGTFRSGDYVETSAETAYFASLPNKNATAQGKFSRGTTLIVLNVGKKYMHVQSEEGEVGYVENAAVVPQGVLVTNADEAAEVVNWSDIADQETESEAANQLPEDLIETPDTPDPVEEVELQVDEVVTGAQAALEEAKEEVAEAAAVDAAVEEVAPASEVKISE